MTRRHQKIILRVCCLAVALPLAARAQQGSDTTSAATVAEQYLLSAANQERTARGLSTLQRDPQLARAAAQHARVMAEHGTISHQFAGEPELSDRGAGAGAAFSAISENVAEAPSAVTIHDMWMHSEHHRENLLDPAIDSAGISVVDRGGELYAVEDFAKTVPTVPLEAQEAAIAGLIARPGLSLGFDSDSVAAARKTCSLSTGYAGLKRPTFVMRFTSGSLTQVPEELRSRLASGTYRHAAVGACAVTSQSPFSSYNIAVLLYP